MGNALKVASVDDHVAAFHNPYIDLLADMRHTACISSVVNAVVVYLTVIGLAFCFSRQLSQITVPRLNRCVVNVNNSWNKVPCIVGIVVALFILKPNVVVTSTYTLGR